MSTGASSSLAKGYGDRPFQRSRDERQGWLQGYGYVHIRNPYAPIHRCSKKCTPYRSSTLLPTNVDPSPTNLNLNPNPNTSPSHCRPVGPRPRWVGVRATARVRVRVRSHYRPVGRRTRSMQPTCPPPMLPPCHYRPVGRRPRCSMESHISVLTPNESCPLECQGFGLCVCPIIS